MNFQMLFVVGAPRSGTTMLERMLAAHSQIQGGPEPHLLTPLAHLGPWDKVDKAPYDHVLAAQSQKLFIEQLPQGEQDYWDACRAYCDTLYGRYLQATGGKPICLDKTPAYALILPFMQRVFPDARYIVLTRHPLAIFSSYANSFFDGDYQTAQTYNPILERYVPAIAKFLRQSATPHLHVQYEALVSRPEEVFERICAHIGVPYEAEAIEYGRGGEDAAHAKGLGDPIGVKQHDRPQTGSVKKWVSELAHDPAKLTLMRGVIERLDPADLETFGYPLDRLWKPLEESGQVAAPPKPKLDRYRLQRKAIMQLRALARSNGAFRGLLSKVRLVTDVLLRD